jgi:hypothetical protein
MKIDRQQFLQELKLREHIRKAIRVIRERKEKEHKSIVIEETRLRNVIRKILKEEGEGDQSTGIAFLRRDLKKIIPELEGTYTSLRTSADQRKSYRAHILNAIQNLITVSDTNFNATPDKDPGEEAVGIEEAIDINIGDDAPDARKRIDIGREKPEEEKSEVDAEKEKEESELKDFAIAGEDRTGAVEALRSMKQIENVIKKTYNGLFDPNDRDLYADYLMTNLQLYFDEFEEELQAMIPEPENPDYEQRKTTDASGELETGIEPEDTDPL